MLGSFFPTEKPTKPPTPVVEPSFWREGKYKHVHQYMGRSREEYLHYVVTAFVATEEERAEYRDLKRAELLEDWAKHEDKIFERLGSRLLSGLAEIERHKKVAISLRRLGQFDYAAKREEYILLLEQCTAVDGHLKGFPTGWGDQFIDEENYRLCEIKRQEDHKRWLEEHAPVNRPDVTVAGNTSERSHE